MRGCASRRRQAQRQLHRGDGAELAALDEEAEEVKQWTRPRERMAHFDADLMSDLLLLLRNKRKLENLVFFFFWFFTFWLAIFVSFAKFSIWVSEDGSEPI